MTKKEFFNAVVEAATDAELVEFATNQLEVMEQNANRVKAKKTEANKAAIEAVMGVLTEKPQTVKEIRAAIGEGFTSAKISTVCIALCNAGEIWGGKEKGYNTYALRGAVED